MTNITLLTADKVVSEMQNAILKQYMAVFDKPIIVCIMELNLRVRHIFNTRGLKVQNSMLSPAIPMVLDGNQNSN